ncbi:uncharacterized protein BP5553_10161 [Venustampulla echinocandica]|uniref:L-ornithine N(5)-monooxygenase [NAD(P)H] n=1 Tax=Venustampulla echinocandica TaxID=2656787 RepID=A0A370TAI5_9HELO|nr:uncharacterized protein BP5553_10161 [Venustampulla echinocandica]RDL30816.1 hypothetical protein BP5553_10161 [Venustampulla echinocandica]
MAPSAIDNVVDAFHGVNGYHSNGVALTNGLQEITLTNGHSMNGHTTNSDALLNSSPDPPLDLLCVGFGPASLAIAIALHDTYPASAPAPKVLFMEKQRQFNWHAGMQLPGAKMQISFLKDLATPRNPRSHFTFLNYVFQQGRLNHFINLGTFLPSRLEYEDYLRWCAGHFEREGNVSYGMEVEGLRVGDQDHDGKATSWEVTARDQSGNLVTRRARKVVIAVGGRPVIPQCLRGLRHIAHSSQFSSTITQIQAREEGRPLKFAVIGSGQSAAEIFNDLSERFPDAQVKLIIKGRSLRPSDDSPFVNEIFDPDRVDEIYNQTPSERADALALDRGTNYGVVRLELLEHLYERLYMQRLRNQDESTWRCRIITNRVVLAASQSPSSNGVILKLVANRENKADVNGGEEEIEADYVFTATGYERNAHADIISETRDLFTGEATKRVPVGRDYRVMYDEAKVDEQQAGVWLQGCNEATHGLSDTLLSILAVRGGELVQSIFGGSYSNPKQAS